MGADILEYVDKHVGNPMVCDHIIAEIVRLRGEVVELTTRRAEDIAILDEIREAIGGGPYDTVAKRIRAAIAPAEAKGDAWPLCPECQSGVLYECPACSSTNYPQPADDEAVAPMLWLRMKPDGTPDWAEDCVGHDEHFLDGELKSDGYWLKPLYTTPPAPVQAAPQEGEQDTSHWPLLDRVEFALRDAGFDYDEAFRIAHMAAHPSACELGAVRELVKVWRIAVNGASTTNKQDLRPERFIRELEAALQHRGDSRGGEGS